MGESLLTLKQLEVLRLRIKGLSQSEIARIMGSSRANVAYIERNAYRNIVRAVETIRSYVKSLSVAEIEVEQGEDVRLIARKILATASKAGVKLKYYMPEIIDLINRTSYVVENKTLIPLTIYILGSGYIALITKIRDKKDLRLGRLGVHIPMSIEVSTSPNSYERGFS